MDKRMRTRVLPTSQKMHQSISYRRMSNAKLKKEYLRSKGRPLADDESAKKLSQAKEKAKDTKNSRYALGKAPENLKENQQVKLAVDQIQE